MRPSPYRVVIPVELSRGRPFTVTIESTSAQWEAIRPEFREGQVISIPPNQFHYSRAVKDELRFVWRDGELYPPGGQRRILPGAVVIILESPHQFEYTPFYMPIAPLQKPASKTRLRNQLPRLLSEVGIRMGDIVLANPIQFQTSLHRLLQPAYQSGVQAALRDAVWKGLYLAEVNGERVVEAEFRERIRRYQPSLIINACTAGVRGLVAETFCSMPYKVMGVNHHPSYWSRTTRLVP